MRRRSFWTGLVFTVAISVADAAQPNDAFLDSILLVRPGIADLGNATVRQYIEQVEQMSLDDGSSPQIMGWDKNNNIYTLRLRFKGSPVQMSFVHDLSSRSKGVLSLLQSVNIGGEVIDGLMFTMLMSNSPKRKAGESPHQESEPRNMPNAESPKQLPAASLESQRERARTTKKELCMQDKGTWHESAGICERIVRIPQPKL